MGSIFEKYKILHGLPLPGQSITYSKPSKWSWFTNVLENEKTLLELGKTYTVEKTELNSSSTYVWLKEFPDLEGHTFFNMHVFDWDLPKLNLDDLIGFASYDISMINEKYGYGFKDIELKILIEGDPYIVIKCDDFGGIIAAWFQTEQYDKLIEKWGPILEQKVSNGVKAMLIEAQEAPYDHIAKIKAYNDTFATSLCDYLVSNDSIDQTHDKLFNVIEVESMTGDCPDEWIKDWISEGYNCIHFIGNCCDEWTLMDQTTIIEEPAWKIINTFNGYDKG